MQGSRKKVGDETEGRRVREINRIVERYLQSRERVFVIISGNEKEKTVGMQRSSGCRWL